MTTAGLTRAATRGLTGSLVPRRYRYGGGAPTYATWNPADKDGSLDLSNGDLTVTKSTGSGWKSLRATVGKTTGKWYYEVTSASSLYSSIGAADASGSVTDFVIGYIGASVSISSHGYENYSGNNYANGVTFGPGDVIGVKIDLDTNIITMLKNNVSVLAYDISARGSNAIYPAASLYSTGNELTSNFGASAFTYEQSGFSGVTV